jgi:hypothetical protein
VDVGEDVDAGEEVVEGDDGVVEEENGFRDTDGVGEIGTGGLRLEVADAVVADVADGATCGPGIG